MKLRNFAKLFTGLLAISALPASIVFSNSNPQIHSSFFVENPTNDISWNIDGKGNIRPTDKSKVSGAIEIPAKVNVGGVDKPVTGIAKAAFKDCAFLTSVTFAEGSQLTIIGNNAFQNCSSLTSVNFGEKSQLNTIGMNAFTECNSLNSINIPSGVTSIGQYAFSGCTSLTSVTIPNSVTSIGRGAFYRCSSLTSITIPKNVTSIGSSVFDSCSSLISINIPKNVTSIGHTAFRGCSSLTSVTIPSSVTSIYNAAFDECSSLKSVVFNENSQLSNIDDFAFSYCPLSNIEFTDNDTYKRIPTKSKDGKEVGAYIIAKDGNLSDDKVAGSLAYGKIDIELPSGKSSIIGDAFNGCSALTSVTIPSSVTSIGDNAFEDCDNLTDVYLNWDENQIKKLQIDDYVFDSTTKKITINFHIPKGMKELYIAQTKDWFDDSAVPNWIEDNPSAPSSNSNLPLILGLTFGFIILIGIGSYLGYRYYKHRKNSK